MDKIYTEDDIQKIKNITNKYKADNFAVPLFHLSITIILMIIILYILLKHDKNTYLNLGLILLLALTQVRLFIIFHDMVHKSYFPSNERETKTNGINFFSSLFLQPFISYSSYDWHNTHSHHHEVMGNSNEIDGTKTVVELSTYNKYPYIVQKLYDFFHNPILFFPIISLYVFFIRKIISFEIQYFILFSIFLFILHYIGDNKLLIYYFIGIFIAGIIGAILFHLQHQVNVGYYKPFDNNDEVEKKNAELKGSTVIKVPSFLKFFTCGIEYHSVHHFEPGIPGYNLQRCYEELVSKNLISSEQISYTKSFESLFHKYYDDISTKMYI